MFAAISISKKTAWMGERVRASAETPDTHKITKPRPVVIRKGGAERVLVGAVEKAPPQSDFGCAHAFEFHSPLEGESARQGRSPQPRWWGELFLWHVPPPNRPSPKGSVSSTPPQGGSDFLSRRTARTLKGGVKFGALRLWTFTTTLCRVYFSCPPVKGGQGGLVSNRERVVSSQE